MCGHGRRTEAAPAAYSGSGSGLAWDKAGRVERMSPGLVVDKILGGRGECLSTVPKYMGEVTAWTMASVTNREKARSLEWQWSVEFSLALMT